MPIQNIYIQLATLFYVLELYGFLKTALMSLRKLGLSHVDAQMLIFLILFPFLF